LALNSRCDGANFFCASASFINHSPLRDLLRELALFLHPMRSAQRLYLALFIASEVDTQNAQHSAGSIWSRRSKRPTRPNTRFLQPLLLLNDEKFVQTSKVQTSRLLCCPSGFSHSVGIIRERKEQLLF
jgi:hypothetical protein